MAGGTVLFPAAVLEDGYGWGERGQGGMGAGRCEDGEDRGGCWTFWQVLCWGSGVPGLSEMSVLLSPTEPSVGAHGPPWQGLLTLLISLGPPRDPRSPRPHPAYLKEGRRLS